MKKELISGKNKIDYLSYIIRNYWFAIIFKISFAAIFLFCAQYFFMPDPFHVINYLISWVIVAIIWFIFSKSFKILFFKNIYVIDGKIFKTHVFHRNSGSSEYNEGPALKARAISDNGGITTPWIHYPKKYKKQEEVKAKIIVRKDKGYDFYIVK